MQNSTPPDNSMPTPRWGSEQRELKAQAILQTVTHFMPLNLATVDCLDIGCGSGGIAAYLAGFVRQMHGIDPEPWQHWENLQQKHPNLCFRNVSVDALQMSSASLDLIICNQVYEHVPDPKLLIAEIYRLLKAGGCCYFAGPNWLFPIEPHVFWPFIHWLPRNFAVKLMRACGSRQILDANSETYWTLCQWLAQFELTNAVPYILKNPEQYGRKSFFWRTLAKLPESWLEKLTFLSPTFVFILSKPAS